MAMWGKWDTPENTGSQGPGVSGVPARAGFLYYRIGDSCDACRSCARGLHSPRWGRHWVSLFRCPTGHDRTCRMVLPSSQHTGFAVVVKVILEYFLYNAWFHSIPGNRWMAPSTDMDVLLETVALYPYQSSKSSQTGYFQKRGYLDISQPQRAMAFVQNHGDTSRYDQ